jgi:ribosome production factor 1
MGKKKGDKSLLGKKPINSAHKVLAKQHKERRITTNPSHIGNKLKRSEMYGKYLQDKAAIKKEKRQQQKEEGGENETKPAPKTIDSTREVEITLVHPDDVEIMGDEADDEFAPYFLPPPISTATRAKRPTDDEDPGKDTAAAPLLVPKVLITTRPNPSKNLFYFIADLQKLVPALHYYPRATYSIEQITKFATARAFTHLLVLSEKAKVCNGLFISHLGAPSPDTNALPGPTAFFKVSNVVTGKNIPHHGASTAHRPELHMHHFSTRLGQRIGRLLASLFPLQQGPQFEGRQVVTFHNQRDYIFVRQHRYIFNATKSNESGVKEMPALDTTTAPTAPSAAAAQLPVKTRLQELGPRFTLKLRWLQDGVVADAGGTGEYEFLHKRKAMDTTRRKFHL